MYSNSNDLVHILAEKFSRKLNVGFWIFFLEYGTVVVIVVVDSHIQRIVLAAEETTVTQQVSHGPTKCQFRL